jgi:hypothetical protein
MAKLRGGARGAEAPRARSKFVPKRTVRAASTADIGKLLADFKTGLGKLSGLTSRLSQSASQSATSSARIERRELLKTLERELRILERTAPPEIRERVVREFRSKAESAIQMGVPQAYAELVSAAPYVPSKALRPNQHPAVKSVLQAVKAIRSGRLAFLPRETRVEARKLLKRIFGSSRTQQTPRAAPVAKTVERQRILPLVVQGMMRSYENPDHYEPYVKAVEYARNHYFPPEPGQVDAAGQPAGQPAGQLDAAGQPVPAAESRGVPHTSEPAPPRAASQGLPHGVGPAIPGRPQSTPIGPLDVARLSKAGVPSFQTTGLAHAFMYEPDREGVQAVYSTDGLVTSAETPTTTPAAPDRAPGRTPKTETPRAVTSSAPMAQSGRIAEASGGQPTLNADDRPVQMSGKITIDGMNQWAGWLTTEVTALKRKLGM